MKRKTTAAQLAKRLGISRATVFNLRRNYFSEAPRDFENTTAWREFALRFATNPEAIDRLTAH